MVKVADPFTDFLNVITMGKKITLVDRREGYHVRKWIFARIFDPDFAWVTQVVTTLGLEEWTALPEEKKEIWNNLYETYFATGISLFVEEIKKGSFHRELDTDYLDRQRLS